VSPVLHPPSVRLLRTEILLEWHYVLLSWACCVADLVAGPLGLHTLLFSSVKHSRGGAAAAGEVTHSWLASIPCSRGMTINFFGSDVCVHGCALEVWWWWLAASKSHNG